jgi:hypothetical protein
LLFLLSPGSRVRQSETCLAWGRQRLTQWADQFPVLFCARVFVGAFEWATTHFSVDKPFTNSW